MNKTVEDLKKEIEAIKETKFLTKKKIKEIGDTLKRPNLRLIGIEEGEDS